MNIGTYKVSFASFKLRIGSGITVGSLLIAFVVAAIARDLNESNLDRHGYYTKFNWSRGASASEVPKWNCSGRSLRTMQGWRLQL
jgi:hypothetical protein